MPVLSHEPARLREDAALPVPEVHGTELHRAGGVEQPAVTRSQDGEAGPPGRQVPGRGRIRDKLRRELQSSSHELGRPLAESGK